ncbi:Uncharacterised protein [Pseudomonas fluorescens]|uniref:Uncharacterized protein n=1 Tax=Pseudomonas fluorescens TaxID=294 RepID=A0A379IC13_PSEFL|nr:hypothetical protein HZ99_00460 [Pseudomonas fluorescens]SUD30397.1 Uncharacterised protein [Pseudomonas fluorescens]
MILCVSSPPCLSIYLCVPAALFHAVEPMRSDLTVSDQQARQLAAAASTTFPWLWRGLLRVMQGSFYANSFFRRKEQLKMLQIVS